jgi:hypothetical protein
MTTADGSVLGCTKIVDRGSPAVCWNLLFLGDGYRSTQLAQYASDVTSAATVLLNTPPFSGRRPVINVYRVDVSSTDSGADDPVACGGSGAVRRTYFDATFCTNGIQRLLTVNAATALAVAGAQLPEYDAVLVVVNSTVYGGSGGAVGVFSLAPNATEIAIHELGHSAFGLADEYMYYRGCGSGETDRDNHPPIEPVEPNVTIASTRATIKWRDLILSTTPVPTMSNPDCSRCDDRPSPVPAGTVGAFEGAHYHHCRAYRPEHNCKMLALGAPFCAVCQRRIRQVLPTTVPHVRELRVTPAVRLVRAAGLVPRIVGTQRPDSWVWRQSPRAAAIVASGSTVTMELRSGPIP